MALDSGYWESPIMVNTKHIIQEINNAVEGEIMEAVMKVGVYVDKERLIQALSDARSFYDEGYEAGQKVVRPRDVLMNPVRKYRTHYSDDYCPVCGKQQKTAKRSMEKPWYCERCGQKLGWEGFNGTGG